MDVRKQPIHPVFYRIALLLCLVFGLSKTGYMQAESAYYDLGRTVLRKDFTPVMTIDGEELQRFFYADVRDAIMARVGVMQNLVFVVDGTIINDINTYSVFDIQEVILLEQAVIATQGAAESRLLVLVTTHSQDERAGSTVTAAAKAGWIGEPGKGIYQQYYAGARYGGERLGGGVSLDYLRDGTTPFEDRYKARVFGRYNVAPGHRLHAEVSYTPSYENVDSVRSATQGSNAVVRSWQHHANGAALQSRLGFSSRFSERFENEFTAAYVWNGGERRDGLTHRYDQPDISGFRHRQRQGLLTRHLLISDRLRYTLTVGDDLVVAPQLHVGWRKGELWESTFTESRQLENENIVSMSEERNGVEISLLSFTPAVDLKLWKAVNVHGGAAVSASPDTRVSLSKQDKRIFPFVVATADVIELLRTGSRWSGLLTASYAQSGYFYDDFGSASEWNVLTGTLDPVMRGRITYGDADGRNDRLTVGTGVATKDRGFALQYTFSHINSNTYILLQNYIPGQGGGDSYGRSFVDPVIVA